MFIRHSHEVSVPDCRPGLMKKNRINELIALVFKWMYVPTLESNNQWLLRGMANYFKKKRRKSSSLYACFGSQAATLSDADLQEVCNTESSWQFKEETEEGMEFLGGGLLFQG